MAHTSISYRQLRDRFEEPEKYIGYRVCDPEGRKLGSVKELFTNAYDEPEYVKVWVGFFKLRSVLIPVGFVAADEKRKTLTLL